MVHKKKTIIKTENDNNGSTMVGLVAESNFLQKTFGLIGVNKKLDRRCTIVINELKKEIIKVQLIIKYIKCYTYVILNTSFFFR